MKRSTLLMAALLALVTLYPSTSQAQDRLRTRDLEGTTWKMVFDIDNREAKEEADNPFARIVLSAVDGLLDEIDIYFEFSRKGHLSVWVGVFGEEEEDERSDWRINQDGQLEFGETDSFEVDDTVWLRYGDRLVPFERKRGGRLERQNAVYLKRVD